MKIVLTGGGTGGHFYPIIAIAEALYELSEEEKLLTPEIILMSDTKYDAKMLASSGVAFKKINAGKVRRYFSLLNITDPFKTLSGIIKAIWVVYKSMPDVIVGKGGYASFPPLLAGRIFGIPVIIHESDSVPGKVNLWASKFAKRIAVSFPEASKFFPKSKTALTGTPVRKGILGFTPEEGREVFNLEESLPTILILGGSQGAQKINDILLDIVPELIKSFQIIHQCGEKNEAETKGRADVVLTNSIFKNRYQAYGTLDNSMLRNASSVADLVISRGGGSAIYEISLWGIPSIIIPIYGSAQDHQRENAYSYARSGAAEVIEEINLTPNILLSEINRIATDEKTREAMSRSAQKFAKPEAARKIAQEIINMALKHS